MEKKCDIMHKYGPFVINKEGGATRKCFCCNEVRHYENIGNDINDAIKRQEDVSFFVDLLINRKINFSSSDDFIRIISYINDDVDYLYISDESLKKLIGNISFYNSILGNGNYDFINEFCHYLELYFAKNRYEYKFGYGSFPDSELDKLDKMSNDFNVKFDSVLNKNNHLIK